MLQTTNSNSHTAARKSSLFTVNYLAKVAILGALALIVNLFSFPLPFAPPFYELDLSEAVVFIGAFALGPVAGMLIELLKILLNLIFNGTITAGVGEFANFLMGCSLVMPAAWIYKRKKTFPYALIGLGAGTVSLVIVSSITNLFVLLPAYSYFMGIPLDALIAMGTKVNASITELSSFVLLAVVPFNVVKGLVCSLITALLYKRLSPLLHKQFGSKRG